MAERTDEERIDFLQSSGADLDFSEGPGGAWCVMTEGKVNARGETAREAIDKAMDAATES